MNDFASPFRHLNPVISENANDHPKHCGVALSRLRAFNTFLILTLISPPIMPPEEINK